MVWARGLVVRAEHEGVGLSRSWFATAEQLGIEIRYGTAAIELLIGDDGRVSGVKVRDDDGMSVLNAALGRARLRRLRGQRADAHPAYRSAGRRRQSARHAAQPGRRPADGDECRRHAVGPVERLPRDADQRRLGRFRAARTDRSQQPPELCLRRHAQPQGQALRRRRRGRRAVHLRQVRPRDSRRARRQGLADLRLARASICWSRATRPASRSPPTRSKT